MQNILHLIRNNGVPIQKGDVLCNHTPFLEFVGGVVRLENWPNRLIRTHLSYDLTLDVLKQNISSLVSVIFVF